MDKNLSEKIRYENRRIHNIEAKFYDKVHPEIWNFYEQKKTNKDINYICDNITSKNPLVLDVGCGTGNLTLKFLNKCFKVIALDISKEMLKELRKKIKNDSRCEFVNSNVDSFLDNEGSNKFFDVIAFSSVLHHLPDYNYTLRKAFNLLKDGGYIYILHEPTLRNNKGDMIGTVLYSIDRLVSPLWLYHRLTTPKMDYSLSDYHVQQGIDQMALKELLIQHGFIIVYFALYNARKNGIISIIDSYFTKPENRTSFKLIAKKCTLGQYIRGDTDGQTY